MPGRDTRPLTVLYAGTGLAGRSTSLDRIIPLRPSLRGEGASSFLDLVARREEQRDELAAGIDWRRDGARRRVRIVCFHAGNLHFPSIRSALTHEHPPIRRSAERVLTLLPDLDGVVFVADSQELRWEANTATVDHLRDDLASEGVSLDAIPVVFQVNKRDRDGARSIVDLRTDLWSANCSHVESVATEGTGVETALATLISMIDAAPRLPRPAAAPSRPRAFPARVEPAELEALFSARILSERGDGRRKAGIVTTSPGTLVLSSGRFVVCQTGETPILDEAVPPGRYSLEHSRLSVEFFREGAFVPGWFEHVGARVTFTRIPVLRLVPLVENGAPLWKTHIVFGDPAGNSLYVFDARRGRANRDVWRGISACGLRAIAVHAAPRGSQLGPLRISLPNEAQALLADEGPLALCTATYHLPLRGFWGFGENDRLASFTLLGTAGVDLLSR